MKPRFIPLKGRITLTGSVHHLKNRLLFTAQITYVSLLSVSKNTYELF